jgi:hypothetical protein
VSDFPIVRVPMPDRGEFQSRLEGAIDKYWIDLPDLGRCLFKADLRGAWVEKVAATIARGIGLPVISYELAERMDGLKAIVSPSFLLDCAQEIPGEKLLVDALGRNYLYTPDAILSVVDNLDIAQPSSYKPPVTVSTASDLLTGYLLFDSWIGNIDRHSRNWGIQERLDGRIELLPTFDHGLALGVRMPDDKLPLDIAGFSADCRSSIQGEVGGTLTMDGLARRLLELRPKAVREWIERIAAVDRVSIEEIFDRIPEGWVSDVRAQFAVDFLVASRDRLTTMVDSRKINRSRLETTVILPTSGSTNQVLTDASPEPTVILPTSGSKNQISMEPLQDDERGMSL